MNPDGLFVLGDDLRASLLSNAPTQEQIYQAKRAQNPIINLPSQASSFMDTAKKYLPYVLVAIGGYWAFKKWRNS